MLKIAYKYKNQLQNQYDQIVYKDKYKYYNNSNYWVYDLEISEDSWNCLEFVSIDKENNILGYFKANINRATNSVISLSIVNFADKCNIIFSKDLYKFLLNLFLLYDFYKVSFEVIIGNPIQKMYDKYIDKFGRRVVGIKKYDVILHDNKYYDLKLYEIFKSDFMHKYNSKIK